jgi:hypothetical protein
MKDGRENPAPSIYGVRYIPHLVIVGKDGIVRSLGHCDKLNEEIEKLLAEEGGYKDSEKDGANAGAGQNENGQKLLELVNSTDLT